MTVYLDNMATTPIDDEVWGYVCSLKDYYGNPHCAHAMGKQAQNIIENAREIIAKRINAEPEEIIFTSGGTEANNLAVAQANGHIMTTATEHRSLLLPIVHSGLDYTILPVNMQGIVNTFDVENAICDDTDMVSVIFANNELGTINDIATCAEIAHVNGALFHTDAVAAMPHLDIDVKTMNIDMLSMSAHKLGGLKGTGALYTSKLVDFDQFNLRGTENVSGIAAFGKTIELLQSTQHLGTLSDALKRGILKRIPSARINNPSHEIPVLNVQFEGIDGKWLVQALSNKGIYVSQGSCSNRGESHVLKAIGLTREQAQSSIRFSIGKQNTVEEINYVVDVLSSLVNNSGLSWMFPCLL